MNTDWEKNKHNIYKCVRKITYHRFKELLSSSESDLNFFWWSIWPRHVHDKISPVSILGTNFLSLNFQFFHFEWMSDYIIAPEESWTSHVMEFIETPAFCAICNLYFPLVELASYIGNANLTRYRHNNIIMSDPEIGFFGAEKHNIIVNLWREM